MPGKPTEKGGRHNLVRWLGLLELDDATKGCTIRELQALLILADPRIITTGMQTRRLADELFVCRPVVSRIAKDMAKRGLMQSAPDPYDGRGCYVMLTHRGEQLAKQLVARNLA